jgi:hypothetical protein
MLRPSLVRLGQVAGRRIADVDPFDSSQPAAAPAPKRFGKVAFIAGGYVVCFLIASAVVAVRIAATGESASNAAGGMYGFGDTLLFVAAFGVPALVPTGAALFYLRPYLPFWKMLSALGVAMAATGVGAAILYAIGRHEMGTPLATWVGFSVLRVLISPLLVLGFIVCAVFSPHRPSRIAFIAAAVMEAAVSAYVGVVWFVPMFLNRP